MPKDERIIRSTLRGLKKCSSCGCYNGNRAKGCINKNCSLHFLKKFKKNNNSIDPIQLVTYNDTKLYSVRNKEREPFQRNFVQITDTTLSSDKNDGSIIISRNAICYVDTCKYDSSDLNLSCKHVKSASECQIYAQEIKISKDILFSMKITKELKTNLWSLYSSDELIVPSIQRINKSTFVIKCLQNINFPAGRLHVKVKPDNDGDFDYMCACKKMKILLSPNNTMVLENDACDHVLLLLAGILSSQHLQNQFQNLIKSLKTFWDQNDFITTFDDNDDFLQNADLYNFTESLLNSVIELDNGQNLPGNIFQNDENSSQIRTQTDISNGVNDVNKNNIQSIDTVNDTITTNIDDNNSLAEEATTSVSLPSSLLIEPQLSPISPSIIDDEYLELADCQIELMDQFKLTDQIDLCSSDVLMNTDEFFEMDKNVNLIKNENNILSDTRTIEENHLNEMTTMINIDNQKTIIHGMQKTIKMKKKTENDQLLIKQNKLLISDNKGPLVEFNEWLEFVIEQINMSIDANAKNTNIKHVFSIKNEFFEHLSQKFGFNNKRRTPNETVIIKTGKFKGLAQLKWQFYSIALIKRIFTTQNLQIEFERYFIQESNGTFKLYKEPKDCDFTTIKSNNKKFKKILPDLFCTFISLDINSKEKDNNAFSIEWTPNVFPKSQFGIMKIEFSIDFRKSKKS